MDFCRDDGVEPTLDDVPNGVEGPGGAVDEDGAEGFRVVGFEDFDHKFDGGVVLIGK